LELDYIVRQKEPQENREIDKEALVAGAFGIKPS